MKRLTLILFVTAFIFAMMPSGVALADQANPDSTPDTATGILGFNVFRDSIEPGDQLYLIYASIPYAAVPDALVTEAFIWQLRSGASVLAQTTGTAYQSNGYGYNVYSMYFSATAAPTWEQEYTIRLAGNPTVFDVPPLYDYTLSTDDYNDSTTQAEAQSALALRIISIANDLDTRWGLTSTTTLVNEQETGTVLSGNGETLFRSAIYGLQAMAPAAFQIGVGTITATDREWETEYAANVTTQYSGTYIGTAQAAGATMFNKGYDLLSILFLLAFVVAIVVANVMIKSTIWAGLVDATLLAVLFARLGIPAVLLPFLGLIAALAWVYISAKTWGVVR